MKVVGLTGGIGSGKTYVSKIFQSLGIAVFNADEEAKMAYLEDEGLKTSILDFFGSESFVNGVLNRAFLAQQVFNNPEKLAVLNSLVHPVVAERFRRWKEKQNSPYVIKEAAILFESGAYKEMDQVICVMADDELRIQRATERDGSTEAEVRARMSKQWNQDEIASRSDYRINNNSGQLILPQVIDIHESLKS